MNEVIPCIKTEDVDIETVVLDQNFSSNLIGVTMSESTSQIKNIYTNANDLPLLKTEYISDSIPSESECELKGNNKCSKQSDGVEYLNKNLDTLLDYKIDFEKECKESKYENSQDYINVPYPINLKTELEEQYPKNVLVQSPAKKYSTANSHSLKMHQCKQKNESATIRKKCPYCNYASDNSYFKRHINEVHDQILENCPYCNFKGNYSNRSEHVMTVHDKILRSCSFCDFKGLPTNNGKHIMAYHDQIRPFKCHSCEYSTASQRNWKRHIAAKHNNQKVRFKIRDCPFCNYNSSLQSINRHVRAVHDQIRLQDQILQSCRYCNFKGNSYSKNRHIKTVHDQIRSS